jgi:hypothetical protein
MRRLLGWGLVIAGALFLLLGLVFGLSDASSDSGPCGAAWIRRPGCGASWYDAAMGVSLAGVGLGAVFAIGGLLLVRRRRTS